jgi:putative PIG3 family NAD(P)H quinone oxidoreductase
MRAITLKNFGGPDVLTQTTVPQPVPAANQILVHVKACGLNRADLLQRRGKYPPPTGESDILGLEIAGNIAAMGADVSGFGVGEKVFGLVAGGAYADYCLIDQGSAMPIPENFSYVEAAAIPEAFLTAQEAVFTLGQLQPNESILIHAGGSGVGSAAIQLARQLDAVIYTTAGSAEKIAKIKNFGADYIFNYKEQDFAEEIMLLTENHGVNVIIDFIGAEYFMQHLRILSTKGRMSLVGLMRGTKAEADLGLIHQKRLQIKGLVMRRQTLAEKRRITQHFAQHWLPLFVSGKLKPVIDSVFPFTEVQAAHEHMENNLNVGKIILNFESLSS